MTSAILATTGPATYHLTVLWIPVTTLVDRKVIVYRHCFLLTDLLEPVIFALVTHPSIEELLCCQYNRSNLSR